MKIAIMSDSHDNIVNLTKALKFINKEKIKTLIHCGDLCAPSILTEVLAPNFKGKIHLVHGNVGDPELLERVAKRYKNITIYGYKGETTIDKKKSLLLIFPKMAKN